MVKMSSQSSLNKHLTVVIALAFCLWVVLAVGQRRRLCPARSSRTPPSSSTTMSRRCSTRTAASSPTFMFARDKRFNAGDILLTLDGTSVRANLEIVESSLAQLYLRRARLDAERRGATDFKTDILVLQKLDGPERQPFIESEKQLLKTRVSTLDAQRRQLEERKLAVAR